MADCRGWYGLVADMDEDAPQGQNVRQSDVGGLRDNGLGGPIIMRNVRKATDPFWTEVTPREHKGALAVIGKPGRYECNHCGKIAFFSS